MVLKTFVFNPLQENTYIIADEETRECVVIDPGCYEQEEKAELTQYIADNQFMVKMLWNTHCHIDHVLGNEFIKQQYSTRLYIHRTEEFVLNAQKILAPHYGFYQYEEAKPDEFINENDRLTVGAENFLILFVPGHSPGHIAFYNEKQKAVIGGDVLFSGSIGRTDLPGGNFDTLISSIHNKLFTLPDDVTVYPGHGPETTIGIEKRTNPFCALSGS